MLEIKRGVTYVLYSQGSVVGEAEKLSNSSKTVLFKHSTMGNGRGVKSGRLPGRGTICAEFLWMGRSGPFGKGGEGCSIPK